MALTRFLDASSMPTGAVDAKAAGRAKLAERRLRTRRLRRNVIAIAATLFVAVWGVIFVRLVTGHDPVLSAKAQTVAATSGSSSSTTSSGSTGSTSGATSSGSGDTSSGSSSSGLSSVTTQQS